MKIDLKRAYDFVEWAFLRIILMKIGLEIHNVEWIIACVKDACLVVLINGFPPEFFRARRGLWQGCSLRPLLFIFIMDIISKKIISKKQLGTFMGVYMASEVSITHLFFVDNILTFGIISRPQWEALHNIFLHFGVMFGLIENGLKSFIIHSSGDMGEIKHIADIFGVGTRQLQDGFSYLGFTLNPFGYQLEDWTWSLHKFD